MMTVNIKFTNGKLARVKEYVQKVLDEKYKGKMKGKEMVITRTTIQNVIGNSHIYGYELVRSGTYRLGQIMQNNDGSSTEVVAIM